MQIMIFGDSIAQGMWDTKMGGWVNRLSAYLQQKTIDSNYEDYYSIVNLGVSGDTTRDIVNRLQNEIDARVEEDQKPTFVFSIGINDTFFLNDKNENQISLIEFKDNLHKILSISQKYTNIVSFLELTPIDQSKVDTTPWASEGSYLKDQIKKYNDALREFCVKNELDFIDINLDVKEHLQDGVHPNAKGHQIIFEYIKNYLENPLSKV